MTILTARGLFARCFSVAMVEIEETQKFCVVFENIVEILGGQFSDIFTLAQ